MKFLFKKRKFNLNNRPLFFAVVFFDLILTGFKNNKSKLKINYEKSSCYIFFIHAKFI